MVWIKSEQTPDRRDCCRLKRRRTKDWTLTRPCGCDVQPATERKDEIVVLLQETKKISESKAGGQRQVKDRVGALLYVAETSMPGVTEKND
jgi:hypothetical protein